MQASPMLPSDWITFTLAGTVDDAGFVPIRGLLESCLHSLPASFPLLGSSLCCCVWVQVQITSDLVLLQLFILAKEIEGTSQGTIFAVLNLNNSDHIFLQPRLEQSSICGKCPHTRGQHKSSLVNSGHNTLNPVELFMVQDSMQSEENTAASSKEMVAGPAAVPSWYTEESVVDWTWDLILLCLWWVKEQK